MRVVRLWSILPALVLLAGLTLAAPGHTAGYACQGKPATLVGTPGPDVLRGTSASDVIVGLDGDDRIFGAAGDDVVCGDDGADRLIGGPGDDLLAGGAGTDTVDYSATSRAVSVDLGTSPGSASGAGSDRLYGVESVVGTPWSDELRGSQFANGLSGLGGRDDIYGRDGNDVLAGGGGPDYLGGGPGDDALDGGDGADSCRQQGGSGGLVSCERTQRPSRENTVVFYQQVRADDVETFAGAASVVVSAQADEAASVDLIHRAGSRAIRYVQFYWFPAHRRYDGIDLGLNPSWAFCREGAAPLIGRVGSDGEEWLLADANEEGALAAMVQFLQQTVAWGYDGVFFDRGGSALWSEPDYGAVWWLRSTCTETPVGVDSTFSGAYVRLMERAKALGLDVILNYGNGPLTSPRMRPDPADPDCRVRAWDACSTRDDVWGNVTQVAYEGASSDGDERFRTHFEENAAHERATPYRGTARFLAIAKTDTVDRASAFYRWSMVHLFALATALNTGDSCVIRTSPGCQRLGTWPELTRAALGDPLDSEPGHRLCSAPSSDRCLWIRRYDWGLVVLNVGNARRSTTVRLGLPSCRFVLDVYRRAEGAGGRCVTSLDVSVPSWSGRVYRYETAPW